MDNQIKDKIRSWLPFIYLLVALFALRWTFVEPYVVPTSSMEPTLKRGDRLYALKCAYDFRFPFTDWTLFKTGTVKRGDVILFRPPHKPELIYVKRAIGLPGDRIEFREGALYINGEKMEAKPIIDDALMVDLEDGARKSLLLENLNGRKHYALLYDELFWYAAHMRDFAEVTIPEGHLLAVGDNRDNSADSREWGFLPMDNLKGRAMFIWFSSWEWRIRPERIGTLIQ